jgi:hypothetical protein
MLKEVTAVKINASTARGILGSQNQIQLRDNQLNFIFYNKIVSFMINGWQQDIYHIATVGTIAKATSPKSGIGI